MNFKMMMIKITPSKTNLFYVMPVGHYFHSNLATILKPTRDIPDTAYIVIILGVLF